MNIEKLETNKWSIEEGPAARSKVLGARRFTAGSELDDVRRIRVPVAQVVAPLNADLELISGSELRRGRNQRRIRRKGIVAIHRNGSRVQSGRSRDHQQFCNLVLRHQELRSAIEEYTF